MAEKSTFPVFMNKSDDSRKREAILSSTRRCQKKKKKKLLDLLIIRGKKIDGRKKDRSSGRRLSRAETTSDFSGACSWKLSTLHCFFSTIGKWFCHGESFALFHGPRSFWPINSLRGNVPLAETSACRGWALRADSRQQQLFRMRSRRISLTTLLLLYST